MQPSGYCENWTCAMVLRAKPGDHEQLFHWVEVAAATRTVELVREVTEANAYELKSRRIPGRCTWWELLFEIGMTRFDLSCEYIIIQHMKPLSKLYHYYTNNSIAKAPDRCSS